MTGISSSINATNAYQAAAKMHAGKADFGAELKQNHQQLQGINNDFSKLVTQNLYQTAPAVINDVGVHTTNPAAHIFRQLRRDLKKQEDAAHKNLIGEGSMLELTTATAQAKHTVKTFVSLRDELLKTFEKIFSMQV